MYRIGWKTKTKIWEIMTVLAVHWTLGANGGVRESCGGLKPSKPPPYSAVPAEVHFVQYKRRGQAVIKMVELVTSTQVFSDSQKNANLNIVNLPSILP